MQSTLLCRARSFAEHASLQSTLLCRARSFAARCPLQSTLLCRAHFFARFFTEHASLQSTLLCRARFFAEHSPLRAPLQHAVLCRARFFAEHTSLQSTLRGASQLWSWVCSSSVFVLRRPEGQSASGAVKGEGGPVSSLELCSAGNGGESALELCCLVLRGMEASQLPGCEGGSGASQLWSLVVVLLFLGGAGGQSASGL